MAAQLEAIVFDLFGTLVFLRRQLIARQLPKLLGMEGRAWVDIVRKELLVRSFASQSDFVDHIVQAAPNPSPDLAAKCLEMIASELDSAEPVPGVLSMLAFLKRRGYRLGLVSNLTSVHEQVLDTLMLRECFDAVFLSSEEGKSKPHPEVYSSICERLGCAPEKTLFVGDSLKNDVVGPRSLGMPALRVGGKDTANTNSIATVTQIGWLHLAELPRVVPVMEASTVSLNGVRTTIHDVQPLPDSEQGRYNLVARARAVGAAANTGDAPGPAVVFVKRFLLPEAAHVEDFASSILDWLGLPSCNTTVSEQIESCLIATAAAGTKYRKQVSADIAFEVGRHGAASYIFANGDFRPRNAFLATSDGRDFITMVDLEHFFFNLALDVDGLADPFNPATIDRLSDDEVARRLKRRVLSERTTRRAMRSFLEVESIDSELGKAFLAGWLTVYLKVQSETDQLMQILRERVNRKPFLVIGTRFYRRAMATIDIEDIRSRIETDAEELAPKLVAYKKAPA